MPSIDFVFPLSVAADPVALAPLLCAGLIGYRSLSFAGEAQANAALDDVRSGRLHGAAVLVP